MKGVPTAAHSPRYTEPQLWILLHFHMDLKHTHTLWSQSHARTPRLTPGDFSSHFHFTHLMLHSVLRDAWGGLALMGDFEH